MPRRVLTDAEFAIAFAWKRKRPEFIDPVTAAAMAGISKFSLKNRREMGRINPQTFAFDVRVESRPSGLIYVTIYSKRQVALWVASGLKMWPPRIDDEILMRDTEVVDYLRRATGRHLTYRWVMQQVERGLLPNFSFGNTRHNPPSYTFYSRYDVKHYIITILLPRRHLISQLPQLREDTELATEDLDQGSHVEAELDVADGLDGVDTGLTL